MTILEETLSSRWPLHLSINFNIYHTIVGYYNISSKFNFQIAGLKVKVNVAILENTLSSL